jgi:hypothetical protein
MSLDPQDDEIFTLPLCFFTLIVNVALPLPETVTEAGSTWICPLLLEDALIVALPL